MLVMSGILCGCRILVRLSVSMCCIYVQCENATTDKSAMSLCIAVMAEAPLNWLGPALFSPRLAQYSWRVFAFCANPVSNEQKSGRQCGYWASIPV
jgi:hypothetical protein